eukprot:gnl/TRDRNA2_/TRDRNA2_174307_c0_seq1.p2 gnl/TRDRNA2_/TRDRNA2_174307_c0~~gnl/TRDRNA2_/TRDRNA2_174307_c0_seq1.p2  ORF type:complete len:128 (+),score=9.68 gnl/TRDRNA2_/TRDRNA2_174307_c0_seq1:477-860(+)
MSPDHQLRRRSRYLAEEQLKMTCKKDGKFSDSITRAVSDFLTAGEKPAHGLGIMICKSPSTCVSSAVEPKGSRGASDRSAWLARVKLRCLRERERPRTNPSSDSQGEYIFRCDCPARVACTVRLGGT